MTKKTDEATEPADDIEKRNLRDINRKSRTWLMTVFTHVEEGDSKPIVKREQVEEALNELAPEGDWCFQLEAGHETHHLHFQIALCLPRTKTPRRKDVLRVMEAHGIDDAHAEVKPRKEAAEYCSKVDTRVSGPWFSSERFQREIKGGTVSKQGQRNDLAPVREGLENGLSVADMLRAGTITTPAQLTMAQALQGALNSQWEEVQRSVEVHYLYGATGTGKTRYIYDHFEPKSLYVANLNSRDPFENYSYQPVLVLDEFRNQIPISNMLQMLDRYPYQIDRRYHNVYAAWTKVFITSNWTLDRQYLKENSEDRRAFFRRITDTMAFPMQRPISRFYERDLFTGESIKEPVITPVYSDGNDEIIKELNDDKWYE